MYDYRLKGEKQDCDYILNYEVDKDKYEIKIEFAKSKEEKGYVSKNAVFKNLIYNKENIEKVNGKMKRQVLKAIQNEKKFVLNRNVSTAICVAATAVTGVTSVVGGKYQVAIGTVAIASALISGYKATKENKKLDELKLADYILHNDELNNINKEQNELVGTSKSFQSLIEKYDDPFVVNNYDDINIDDLKVVMTNKERNKKLNLAYKK